MSIHGKLFKDLTEEEILGVGLEVIPEFRERFRITGEFDVGRCVEAALWRIERLYKSKHGLYKNAQMSRRERGEMDQVMAHFQPLLYARITEVRQRILQARKVSEINAATAKALITERFREAGLKAEVTGQMYRACVKVTVSSSYRVRFYLNYKKMLQDGVLDEAVSAVQDLAKAMDRLGYGAVVERH
ncbi:MAG: hypothetical protein IK098_02415 [Bacteroidales bacterium]|jgi:hypothetical protein|nr:hypothetical protein [Bacteroidales bacterium]